MNSFALFTDASLDPRSKCGAGVYLLVPVCFLKTPFNRSTRKILTGRVKKRRFEQTSSTRLEVQTLLWALDEIEKTLFKKSRILLQVYTDSQCISGLPGRRSKLSSCGFRSKKTGQLLKNADLYRTVYANQDRIGFSIIKVSGHTRFSSRDTVHHIFACVDQEARKVLKEWNRVFVSREKKKGL